VQYTESSILVLYFSLGVNKVLITFPKKYRDLSRLRRHVLVYDRNYQDLYLSCRAQNLSVDRTQPRIETVDRYMIQICPGPDPFSLPIQVVCVVLYEG
jgi:hypothetical protein